MQNHELYFQIDSYIGDLFNRTDVSLEQALRDSDAAGLPAIHVSQNQGRLLYLFAKLAGARRILEVGLLAGYSTIWLGRALPSGGRLVSLELLEKHASVARKNVDRAGVGEKIEIKVGSAAESLKAMIEAKEPAFDLIFIDADKDNYPEYFDLTMKLTHPGTLIIGDNVIRDGGVLDEKSTDPVICAVRQFNQMMASDPRLEGTIIPLPKKGIDGFAVARVK